LNLENRREKQNKTTLQKPSFLGEAPQANLFLVKPKQQGWVQCHMPVIPATQEMELDHV
jgi:hypothetical protein